MCRRALKVEITCAIWHPHGMALAIMWHPCLAIQWHCKHVIFWVRSHLPHMQSWTWKSNLKSPSAAMVPKPLPCLQLSSKNMMIASGSNWDQHPSHWTRSFLARKPTRMLLSPPILASKSWSPRETTYQWKWRSIQPRWHGWRATPESDAQEEESDQLPKGDRIAIWRYHHCLLDARPKAYQIWFGGAIGRRPTDANLRAPAPGPWQGIFEAQESLQQIQDPSCASWKWSRLWTDLLWGPRLRVLQLRATTNWDSYMRPE